jgi:hypothetical protein
VRLRSSTSGLLWVLVAALMGCSGESCSCLPAGFYINPGPVSASVVARICLDDRCVDDRLGPGTGDDVTGGFFSPAWMEGRTVDVRILLFDADTGIDVAMYEGSVAMRANSCGCRQVSFGLSDNEIRRIDDS